MSLSVTERIPLINLVGPPNSGKTTLFNYLSGKNYKTVNYPGATVEYSIAKFQNKFHIDADLLDSPGIISLSPSSPDEKISIESLYSHPRLGVPDLIIITVDASQLSRHLLLVKQLIEAKFNVVIALTMIDILFKKGLNISEVKLSKELNCDVVKIDGRNGNGINDLINVIERNLIRIEFEGKKVPVVIEHHRDMEWLINSYRIIGEIENKVIYDPSKNGNGFNLEGANEHLKILDNSLPYTIKKNNHKPDNLTLKIDKYLLNKFWGLTSFFIIMSLTFTSIFWLAEPIMNLVDVFFSFLSAEALNLIGSNWLGDFIATGIISGTGSVLVFVPQIVILFLILGLLEDTGYLARGAMLVDKPLSKIGLNGKSFVPMLSGFACAIPAMLAARTIPNKRERLLTIFILPLLSCSARLPVYALLISFLIPGGKSWIGGIVLASIYIFSTASSIIVASIVNKFRNKLIKEVDNSSFILELPAYRKPKLSVVINNTYNSSKVYIKKAGPIILFFSIVLWFLTYFPNYNPIVETNNLTEEEVIQVKSAERLSESYAADLGKLVQPVMTPIGMDWRIGVSLIAAFTAREVFVSSLALIFKVTSDTENLQSSILNAMRNAKIGNTGQKLFTTSTIIGLIVFFVFALQCLSTVAVSKKETGGWRIPMLQIFMFTSTAYILTFIVVNGLRAIGID